MQGSAESPADSTDVWAELDRIFEDERRCSSCSEVPASQVSEWEPYSSSGAFEAASASQESGVTSDNPGRAHSDNPQHAHQRDRKKHFVIVDVDRCVPADSSRILPKASSHGPRKAPSLSAEAAGSSLPRPNLLPPGCQDAAAAQQRCIPDGSRFVDVDPNELEGWELRIAIRALRQRVQYLQQSTSL